MPQSGRFRYYLNNYGMEFDRVFCNRMFRLPQITESSELIISGIPRWTSPGYLFGFLELSALLQYIVITQFLNTQWSKLDAIFANKSQIVSSKKQYYWDWLLVSQSRVGLLLLHYSTVPRGVFGLYQLITLSKMVLNRNFCLDTIKYDLL